MDGLLLLVRRGYLPSGGASAGRDAAASEAGARIRGPPPSVGRRSIKKRAGAMPRPLVLPAVGVLAGGVHASRRPAPCFRAFVPDRSRRAAGTERKSVV